MSAEIPTSSGLVTVDQRGAVTIISMNRPDRRNALSVALREALIVALNTAMADPVSRAIVLAGSGGHFCAGGDLDDFQLGSLVEARERVRRGHVLPRAIATGPIPVVAAVEGSAYGAGLSLAMICDHVVAAEDARLCASFAKVGLMPDYGLIWSLQRRIGQAKANEMLMQAIELSGKAAAEIGLVNEICGKGAALDRAIAVAEELAVRAPLTIAAVKRAHATCGLETIFEEELEMQPAMFLSADFAEAIKAFREKRPPEFNGI